MPRTSTVRPLRIAERRFGPGIGVVLVGALVLVACGGSDKPKALDSTSSNSAASSASSTTTTTTTLPPITKAEYLALANARCETMNTDVRAVPKPDTTDAEATAQYFEQIGIVIADTVAKLRTIPVPPGEEAALEEIYALVDKLIAENAAFAAAIRSGDTEEARAIRTTIDATQNGANEASIAYGLTVCGE